MKYFPRVYPATRTILVFCVTGLFMILAVTLPKAGTFVEVLLCSFYVLLRGFGVNNFIFYQFNTYNKVAHNTFQKTGLILCSLLLLGKAVFFIYKRLKNYRRKHMVRKSFEDDYFDGKFYEESENMVYKSQNEEQKNGYRITDDDFLTKKEKAVREENLPDMSGFIISDEDF